MPVAYWLGLAVLLVASTLLIQSEELHPSLAILFLMLLALYLQGIAPLVQANARIPNVYWPTSEVKYIFETGHLKIQEPVTLAAYRQWPGMHFLTAALVLILGVPLTFVKYASFAWLFLFILASWSIGRRLELPQSSQFLLVALGLASWWETSTYMSKDIALLMYLVVFLLMVAPQRGPSEGMVASVLFGGLVIMHGLTSFVVILMVVALLRFRRQHRLLLPCFATIFIMWHLYAGTTALQEGVLQSLRYPFAQLLSLIDASRYQVSEAASIPWVVRLSQLAYVLLYAGFLTVGAGKLLRGQLATERRNQALPMFALLLMYLVLIVSFYRELEVRLFFFGLVPAICIILLTWRGRLALIVLLTVFSLLLPIRRYAYEAAWGQVTTAELQGSAFLATHYAGQANAFSQFNWSYPLTYHYDPKLARGALLTPLYYPGWPGIDGGQGSPNLSLLGTMRYVILSKQATDALESTYGYDPFQGWRATVQGGSASLVYSSGDYYNVYLNDAR